MRSLGFDFHGRSWLDIAMKEVKISDLKDHLSEHLRAVENGAEVIVTDRGRPIARIVPLPTPSRRIRLRPATKPFSDVRDLKHEPVEGFDIVDLLLEDRRKR